MQEMLEARKIEVLESGIKVSSGGTNCVVDDDGLFIPPSKMTTEELSVVSQRTAWPRVLSV